MTHAPSLLLLCLRSASDVSDFRPALKVVLGQQGSFNKAPEKEVTKIVTASGGESEFCTLPGFGLSHLPAGAGVSPNVF